MNTRWRCNIFCVRIAPYLIGKWFFTELIYRYENFSSSNLIIFFLIISYFNEFFFCYKKAILKNCKMKFVSESQTFWKLVKKSCMQVLKLKYNIYSVWNVNIINIHIIWTKYRCNKSITCLLCLKSLQNGLADFNYLLL